MLLKEISSDIYALAAQIARWQIGQIDQSASVFYLKRMGIIYHYLARKSNGYSLFR